MARSAIPNPLARRHLVEKDLGEAEALRVAEAYLEQGRAVEAVDFLRKASAAERLAALRSDAVRAGDVFLLRAVAAASGDPPQRQEWLDLAEAAAAAGKEQYAVEARRYADRGED